MADRGENNDLKNLPPSVCELIRLVMKKMRYRRKVRQNVQEELTAHFEDELKASTTDQERRTKAHQLVADFGDPKLLAVLLRRAKKRCRPLWRTIVARTFQTVGVLVLCLIVYTMWFMSGKPTIRVDYLAQLNQMSRPPLLDQDNAWPHYEKAINLYVEPIKDGVVEEFISYRDKPGKLENVLRFTDLSEAEQAQILQWIKQNQKHWENLPTEQQKVILKCFEYNFVPIFKKPHLIYSATKFKSMTSHIIENIKQKEPVTEPYYIVGGGPELAGFPDAELAYWMKQDRVPANYLEAVSVAVLNEWIKRYKDLPKSTLEPLSDSEYEYISLWVKQNEPAWQEFVKGSLKSHCYREVQYNPKDKDRRVLNILAPHISDLRNLARLGIWHSRINLKEGKTRQALEDCLALARAGSHWQGKGSLIDQFVGLAIGSFGREEILHLAQSQNLSATDLKELHQQLMQMYPQGYRLIDIESERLWFLDIVQHVFTDGGPGGGHLIPRQLATVTPLTDAGVRSEPHEFELMISAAAGMIHARRDETIAKFNELFDKFTEIAKMTPYQRHVRNLRSYDIISAVPKYRYFLIGIFMPAVDRVSEIGYWGKASHEAAATILALKRWRLEKNAYPAALDELLAAGYLKELPIDPYSDKPLIYRRTNDDFVLYSVGPNFTDDGGVSGKDREGQPRSWRDNGDTLFWPMPESEAKR